MDRSRFRFTNKILLDCFLAIMVLITGCGGRPPSVSSLGESGFDTWVEIFNQKANQWVRLRDQYDPDGIISLTVEDQVGRALKSFSIDNPDTEARLEDTYLSRHEGVLLADTWNWEPIPTGEAWIEDHPITEYDWITFSEGKISDWQVLYGQELLAAAGLPLDSGVLQDYASAWSSGDPEAAADLYMPEAIRYEPLLWGDNEGIAQIKEFSEGFFREYPGARFELLHSFGELPEAGLIGGIYAIHLQKFLTTCDVHAMVILEPDDGRIASEWAFYQPESLLDCGWVR